MSRSRRFYLYKMSSKGLLYLDDAVKMTFVNAMRDSTFLDIFFAQLRPRAKIPRRVMEAIDKDTGISLDMAVSQQFNFVSPCSGEFNFVRLDNDPHCSPLAFRDLVPVSSAKKDGGLHYTDRISAPESFDLVFGASLKQRLHPGQLVIKNDRLYHPITTSRYLSGELGLLGTELTERILALNLVDLDRLG